MRRSHSTHLKDAYADTWDDSARKELRIKKLVRKATSRKVASAGFGSGQTGYIPGSSGANGHEKAAPDLRIIDTPVAVEVTGPLRPLKGSSRPTLRVNPSKIQYARDHKVDTDYWVAWVNGCEPDGEIRFIRYGEKFEQGLRDGTIRQGEVPTRGTMFRFYDIPWDHPCTCSLATFIQFIENSYP